MKTKKKFLSLMLALIMLLSTIFPTNWVDVYAAPTNVDVKCGVCGSAMRFVNSSEPTCSSLGNYAYWTCSNYDCEEANEVVFLDEECTVEGTFDDAMIPMIEHELIERTVPKCGGNGTFTYYVCKYPNCSLEKAFSENNFESEIKINALKETIGHNLISVAEVIPTCQTDGMIPHLQCATCQKRFTDSIHYAEVTLEEMTMPKVDHIWSDNYFSDETQHWFLCLIKGCKNEVAEHTYDQEIVNAEWLAADANCAHGTLYYKSCVCGKVGTETFEVGEPLENHNLTTTWVYDDHNHWYECKTEGCGYKESVTEHKFDLIVMKDEHLASEPDCQHKARYFMSCECGATGTETVEDQNGEFGAHTPGDEWKSNELTHYHECVVDGCDGKTDEDEHSWRDKEVITEPTETEPGVKLVECSVCLHTTEQEIPAFGRHHNWGSTLSSDNTHHWYDCMDEDCEAKKSKVPHEFVNEVIEEKYLNTPATCVAKATYFKSCECGAKGTETFEAGELSTTHDVDKTTLLKDGTNHWYACKVEGCEYKEDLAAHVFDKEVATADFEASKATCQAKARYYKSCVCGAIGDDTFEYGELSSQHVVDTTTVRFDETNHWYSCAIEGCTYKENNVAHVFDKEIATEKFLATQATCVAKATYFKSCECGAKGTETFEAGELSTTHDVDKTVLLKDGTNHWYACKIEGCEYKEDLAAHVFDKEVATADFEASKATCQAKAQYYKSCVCGLIGTDTFEYGETLEHNISTEFKSDDKNHFYPCLTPGCEHKEGVEKHDLEFLEKIKDATCTEKGKQVEKCSICNAEVEVDVELAEHVWETELTKDANSHWYKCSNELCAEKKDVTEHNFDKEIVDPEYLDKAATCISKTTYFKSCVCGEKGTETFEYGELSTQHVVDKNKLYFDETQHFNKCTVEGCTYKENSVDHVFDKEVATADFEASKATCQAKAQYYKSCVCGKAGTDKFESGELAKHVMGTTYEKDETGHWTKCTTTGCTEKSKVEDHVFKDGETKCETCGYEKAHVCKLEAVNAKSATCEKAGNIAHYKCEECSKLYKDKDGKEELKDEDVVVAKKDHKNTWFITKSATKDKVGEFKGTCSVCGTTTKIDIEKLGTSGKITAGSDEKSDLDAKLKTEDAFKLVELTTDEVKEINDGKDFNLMLSVDDIDDDITSSDKKKMEDKMDDDYKLIKYLDITLTKQLLDDGKIKDSEAATETSDELEIELSVPEKMQGKDTYKVLRLHNGKVDILDADYDKDDKTVTFETDEFSTYALVYADKDDVKEESKTDSTTGTVMPDAGDNSMMFLWATMSMISAFGFLVMLQKKKED